MKLKICLPVPDLTKSYLYKYEQTLTSYAKGILRVLHPDTKADKWFKKRNYAKANEGYDNVRGRYFFYFFDIDNNKEDKTIWLDV